MYFSILKQFLEQISTSIQGQDSCSQKSRPWGCVFCATYVLGVVSVRYHSHIQTRKLLQAGDALEICRAASLKSKVFSWNEQQTVKAADEQEL